MNDYVYKKISEVPIHKLLQEMSSNDVLLDFDAVSFYPSAMSDPKSKFPQMETGYAFTKDMNDEFVKNFNIQTSTQGSAILKNKYYNPEKLIIQHIPVEECEKKIEINCTRNGFIFDTLTSVDSQELVKIGGKVVELFEGVFYRENFKVSPFKKVFDTFFEL